MKSPVNIFGSSPSALPEWIRLPSPGKAEPLTGLRRNVLYDLINARLVRSVSLEKPGTIRGARLIETRSLLSYLRHYPYWRKFAGP